VSLNNAMDVAFTHIRPLFLDERFSLLYWHKAIQNIQHIVTARPSKFTSMKAKQGLKVDNHKKTSPTAV